MAHYASSLSLSASSGSPPPSKKPRMVPVSSVQSESLLDLLCNSEVLGQAVVWEEFGLSKDGVISELLEMVSLVDPKSNRLKVVTWSFLLRVLFRLQICGSCFGRPRGSVWTLKELRLLLYVTLSFGVDLTFSACKNTSDLGVWARLFVGLLESGSIEPSSCADLAEKTEGEFEADMNVFLGAVGEVGVVVDWVLSTPFSWEFLVLYVDVLFQSSELRDRLGLGLVANAFRSRLEELLVVVSFAFSEKLPASLVAAVSLVFGVSERVLENPLVASVPRPGQMVGSRHVCSLVDIARTLEAVWGDRVETEAIVGVLSVSGLSQLRAVNLVMANERQSGHEYLFAKLVSPGVDKESN